MGVVFSTMLAFTGYGVMEDHMQNQGWVTHRQQLPDTTALLIMSKRTGKYYVNILLDSLQHIHNYHKEIFKTLGLTQGPSRSMQEHPKCTAAWILLTFCSVRDEPGHPSECCKVGGEGLGSQSCTQQRLHDLSHTLGKEPRSRAWQKLVKTTVLQRQEHSTVERASALYIADARSVASIPCGL